MGTAQGPAGKGRDEACAFQPPERLAGGGSEVREQEPAPRDGQAKPGEARGPVQPR